MRLIYLTFLCLLAPSAHAELEPLARKGRHIVLKNQCNRCHNVTHVGGTDGLPNADRALHCVDCHNWILGTKGDAAAIAKAREDFPDWDRYLENIVHLTEVPDLGTLTRRVNPGFIRAYLDGPFDLRPHLEASMIPTHLTGPQKDAIIEYLNGLNAGSVAFEEAAPKPPGAKVIAQGHRLFVEKGCPTCHVRGNERFNAAYSRKYFEGMRPVARLAPNLRYVPERIPRSVLVRFIQDPQSVDPSAKMPKQAVNAAEASQIADYLLFAPTDAAAHASAPPPLPLLKREVKWDEVFDEVFGKICVHCHMNPESNNGDGGAGNTGGLGFKGVGLELETHAGLRRGLTRDGKRVDVLKPFKPGEEPLLLEALLRRHREAARDYRPPYADNKALGKATDAARPGMPMGLPPLSRQQLQLIKTWIAQGAKGPE